MTEQEFKEKFESDKIKFNIWGKYVENYIKTKLEERVDNIKEFLKIPCEPRVKKTESLIEKAFYRDKNYINPYDEITDKVGIRFVVLIVENIRIIKDIIEENKQWEVSKDRDFEKEREENPTIFDYESVHYIVRNKEQLNLKDAIIQARTPCEIQIRTLLQHAYSELTHDTIYKPKTKVNSSVKRIVARSMALIETTDSLFKEVNNMIFEEEKEYIDLLPELKAIYSEIINLEFEYEKKLNIFILDSYKEILKDIKAKDIRSFVYDNCNIKKNYNIKEIIKENYHTNLIYRQPIVILIYYLIRKKRNVCRKFWPFPPDELECFYTDLGYSFNYKF
ncbi:hypothetical protein OW763_05950 [Clostridium aestuarii]|uniref:RelA/SpoT domain-containing protein n=1 Tax=Clostridium aestuarii TaxID=338193 RepID=A0ABT4CY10_9CLOT|nr:hypothetical protein [Clostridium aestuarii]